MVWKHGKQVHPFEIAYNRANAHGEPRPIRGDLAIHLPSTEYTGSVPLIGDCSLRLLDELVAAEFIGYPPRMSFDRWRLQHLDGNSHNCAAENLEWIPIHYDDAEAFLRREGISLSPPDYSGTVYRRSISGVPTEPFRALNFTESKTVPGGLPTSPERRFKQ
jgi:hypothetical protein